MLLLNLILLIDVTFSTPTPVINSYFRVARQPPTIVTWAELPSLYDLPLIRPSFRKRIFPPEVSTSSCSRLSDILPSSIT